MDWLGWLPSHQRARAERAAQTQVTLLARQHSSVLQSLIQEYDEAMIVCGCSKHQREAIRKKAINALVRKIEGQTPTQAPEPPAPLRTVGGTDAK